MKYIHVHMYINSIHYMLMSSVTLHDKWRVTICNYRFKDLLNFIKVFLLIFHWNIIKKTLHFSISSRVSLKYILHVYDNNNKVTCNYKYKNGKRQRMFVITNKNTLIDWNYHLLRKKDSKYLFRYQIFHWFQ